MKIDIEDAVDRLQCMAREIHIPDAMKRMNPILAESRMKDRKLLITLIPIIGSLENLRGLSE